MFKVIVIADVNGRVPSTPSQVIYLLSLSLSLLTGMAPKSSFNQNSMPPLPPIHSNGKGESRSDIIGLFVFLGL